MFPSIVARRRGNGHRETERCPFNPPSCLPMGGSAFPVAVSQRRMLRYVPLPVYRVLPSGEKQSECSVARTPGFFGRHLESARLSLPCRIPQDESHATFRRSRRQSSCHRAIRQPVDPAFPVRDAALFFPGCQSDQANAEPCHRGSPRDQGLPIRGERHGRHRLRLASSVRTILPVAVARARSGCWKPRPPAFHPASKQRRRWPIPDRRRGAAHARSPRPRAGRDSPPRGR